jgi:hypothetical protein
MDLSKVRAITNNYQDVRLVSLRDWKRAQEVMPRDHGGPYAVLQEGYDSGDFKMLPEEFVLGKSGEWVSTGIFFKLPAELRRQEFVFGTAAEVIRLLAGLSGSPRIISKAAPLVLPEPEDDELTQALRTSKSSAVPVEKASGA